MTTRIQTFWQSIFGSREAPVEKEAVEPVTEHMTVMTGSPVDLHPSDPLVPYLLSHPAPVEVSKLTLASPALRTMRETGVAMIVPLVSQGELIGLLNLGKRLSDQDYSVDDRRLLNNLATQAAPALRVAQLAHQQQLEARERERLEQELKVARIIQQTLLPKNLPEVRGWKLAAHWQPARAVGGDFYDFIQLDNGSMVIIIADVTDKGVPAALVMASARSILRAAAERLRSPGDILQRVNEALVPDIPAYMFVTCLCIVLDPATGELTFANAGHNLPYIVGPNGVTELQARGMPLGAMPGMTYDVNQARIEPNDYLLIYSDGLVEAHDTNREMFGNPRLEHILTETQGDVIPALLERLEAFTADTEQEDDITMVLVQRGRAGLYTEGELLEQFEVESAPGNERSVLKPIQRIAEQLGFEGIKLEQIKTAVAEATMNAMEHGNQYNSERLVRIEVYASAHAMRILIEDDGAGVEQQSHILPDLDAKLAGEQRPRGWGLFLIENMVDDMHEYTTVDGHTLELVLHREVSS